MNSRFTQKAQNALNASLMVARSLGHTYVGSEHLLLGLVAERDSASARLMAARFITADKLRSAVIAMSGKGNESQVGSGDLTPCVKRIIEESGTLASQFGQNYIGTEHILLALLGERDSVAYGILEACSAQISELKNDVSVFLGGVSDKSKSMQKANKPDSKQTSVLSGFGRDLTAAARAGKLDPIIGRDTETSRVIQILSRRGKNNPCLIGEPGVGKTAVVEGLAQRISDGNVPEDLRGKTIIMLDIPSMIAGAKYRGEFEERMKNLMKEVAARPDIILFIDELHTIIGAGAAEGAVDAANILKPALARGEMRMIGATTLDEYRRHIEKDAALERRFQSVTVGEPSESEAEQILLGLRDRFEAHHKLKISDEAITAAVILSKRYIPDRFLPDKAIDLIDETSARLRVSCRTEPNDVRRAEEELSELKRDKEEAIVAQDFERAAELRDREHSLREKYEKSHGEWSILSNDRGLTVKASDIAETLGQWTGIPVGELTGSEGERLLALEKRLKEKIIGQDEAISAVVSAIRRGRLGLSDPNRPTGSFIFLGPTGVGKTELASVLAESVFGDRGSLIRLDMSEYMEKHSVSKLIGSPPGYVGYDEGGVLVERIRRRPYSLVLFDEIEKAHHDIFNILLQILDDGTLTDSHGRSCDFRNTVIILTSNLGSGPDGTKSLGFAADHSFAEREKVMNALKDTFRPEFINRIDEIVVFNRLGADDLRKIAVNILEEMRNRAETLGVWLEFDESAIELIVKSGSDEKYGARPLRRAVDQLVGDALSNGLLNGDFRIGDLIRVKADNDNIVLQKQTVTF